MRIIVVLIVFFCFGLSSINAQSVQRFNNVYTHDGSQNLKGLITTSEGYITVSESKVNGIWNTLILGIDSTGEELWNSIFLFAPQGQGVGLNSLTRDTTNGTYLICGWINVPTGRSLGYVFRFSSAGDSIEFLLGSDSNQIFKGLTIAAGGLTIAGTDISGDLNSALLVKWDLTGETIWSQRFGITNKHVSASNVVSCPDGGYVVAASVVSGGDEDPLVIKTDSLGNKEWQRLFNPSEFTDGYAAIHLSNTGYIYVASGSSYSVQSNLTIRKKFFAKITLSNFMVWSREYGRLSYGNSVTQLKEDRQGNIICSTGEEFFDENGLGLFGGGIIKISSDGDSLWSKNFVYNYFDTSLYGIQYCASLDTSMDGGLVAGGFVSLFDTANGWTHFQDVWVVKFDSNGCYDTLFDCEVGTTGISNLSIEGSVNLYPNPNQGSFSLEFPTDFEMEEIDVFDAFGREVHHQYHYGRVVLPNARSGIHFLMIKGKERLLTKRFMVD